jgi:hypothetical protein
LDNSEHSIGSHFFPVSIIIFYPLDVWTGSTMAENEKSTPTTVSSNSPLEHGGKLDSPTLLTPPLNRMTSIEFMDEAALAALGYKQEFKRCGYLYLSLFWSAVKLTIGTQPAFNVLMIVIIILFLSNLFFVWMRLTTTVN